MKKIYALTLALLLLSATVAFGAKGFPQTVAGITLGESIDEYVELCDMAMASPIPDAPFLSEVHIDSDAIPGIRGGSLTYANSTPGKKVVRVKLKFHDRRQDLFEELLEKYTKAYGKPDRYKGDSFRNVIAWQWDFFKSNDRIGLLLMWSRERQLRPGVSIKMTLDSLVDEEYRAFKMRHDRSIKAKSAPSKIKDLDEFVPR